MNEEIPIRLARKFCEVLRRDLTASEVDMAVARNRTESHPGVCHTHDFCDANETMLEAFEAILGREMDIQSDGDSFLWNEAWGIAKRSEFAMDQSAVEPAKLAIRFGKSTKLVAVDDLAHASRVWMKLREEMGLGASESPQVTVIDVSTGKTVAKIGYNGRVWDLKTEKPGDDGNEIEVPHIKPLHLVNWDDYKLKR
jgi:hypothetical protein